MEEKETAQLPVGPQEVQIQPPSFLDKIKIHKWKILGGFLGVLVFVGAVFGGYKFLHPKTVNAAEIIKKSLEKILEKGTIYHDKALYYHLSLEPNQPEPTPTVYEIWEDQDFNRFKNEVIYPNGKRVIQVFDGDIRWDYNEEENTLRKDVYVYPDPAEKEVKRGERLDLVKTYRDLLDNGILKAYEGELEGRKVWQVIDERANTYWNTFYFDKETFMLLQQEKWEEKEGRKVRTEKMTYQIMESISKQTIDITKIFLFDYLLPEDTKVLERHFNISTGYVESDYYPATSSGILDPTANWKTYTNTKYGYSIKYPEDGRLFEVGETTGIPIEEWQAAGVKTDSLEVQILSYENKESLSSQEYAEKYAPKLALSNKMATTVGGKSAYQHDYIDIRGDKRFPVRETTVVSNGYVILIIGINKYEREEFNAYTLMLSTFRFLE